MVESLFVVTVHRTIASLARQRSRPAFGWRPHSSRWGHAVGEEYLSWRAFMLAFNWLSGCPLNPIFSEDILVHCFSAIKAGKKLQRPDNPPLNQVLKQIYLIL